MPDSQTTRLTRRPTTRLYIVVAVLAVLLVAGAYTAFRNLGTPALGDPPGPKDIVIALPAAADYQHSLLAPSGSASSWVHFVEHLRFPGLLQEDGALRLQPRLASEFEVLAEGRRIEFTLSPDANWFLGQDDESGVIRTEPVTAADVVETWRLLLRLRPELQPRVGVSATSDSTVELRLNSVDHEAFWALATVGILPAEQVKGVSGVEQLEKLSIWNSPLSAGDYVLAEDQAGAGSAERLYTRMPSNQAEEETEATESRMRLSFVAEPLEATSPGVIGVDGDAMGKTTDWLAAVERLREQGYEALVAPGRRYVSVGLNTQRGPVGDFLLREALDAATDREMLVRTVLAGLGAVASNPFPPDSWVNEGSTTAATFNPDVAREVLNGAGYVDVDGDGFVERPAGGPLELVVLVPDGRADLAETGELVIGMWKQVGIRARTEKLSPDAFLKRVFLQRDFDAFLYAWPVSVDMDPSPVWSTDQNRRGGINPVGFISPEVDRLLVSGASTFNLKTRQEAYQALANLMRKEKPHIFLFWPGNVVMVHPDLEGVKPAAQGLNWNPGDWSWYDEPAR